MGVPDDLELFSRMCFLRRFEERVDSLYRQGLVHGPVHLGLGQEAVAAGAAAALSPGDYSLGTYRGHAHALARGAPPDAVLAELLGRAGRDLRWQGRVDAHHQRGAWLLRFLRDRRRAPADRLRAGLGRAAPRQRPGHGVLLRRRDDQHRRVPRGGEPGRGVAAAGRVRLREQLVHGVHADRRRDPGRAARRGPGRRLRAGPDRGGRQRRGRRPAGGRRRGRRRPGRAGPQPGRGADLPAQRPLGRGRRRVPPGRGGGAVARAGPAAAGPRGARRGGHRRGEAGRDRRADHRADLADLARQVLARPVPDPAGAWADVWSDGSWQWRN